MSHGGCKRTTAPSWMVSLWRAPYWGGLQLPPPDATLAHMNPQPLQDLAQKLAAAVPPGVGALRADLEKNFRALLEAGLARMDLVTRAEFDAQCAVLARTRAQLAALEEQLAVLEARAAAPPAGGP